jgi:hypothetical protein
MSAQITSQRGGRLLTDRPLRIEATHRHENTLYSMHLPYMLCCRTIRLGKGRVVKCVSNLQLICPPIFIEQIYNCFVSATLGREHNQRQHTQVGSR